MNEHAAREIIQSKLLILQSKRLMLASSQRRLDSGRTNFNRARVERLRTETNSAQSAYRAAILKWASPGSADYWLVAYSKLIDLANTLVGRLRTVAPDLPLNERYQASTDMERLQDIVEHWTELMRASMSRAVA